MADETIRCVMAFRNDDKEALAAAITSVREMPGVEVLHKGRGALLVKVVADNTGFAKRVEEGGNWIVSVQRTLPNLLTRDRHYDGVTLDDF
ncbi:hypothetical protein [Paraburkholderia youngii]|uniref:hypothetical protein n=1 Tax=Paraburkholderia youngii TaxID=2782701 RepID=UPI003D21987A